MAVSVGATMIHTDILTALLDELPASDIAHGPDVFLSLGATGEGESTSEVQSCWTLL